jgi:hypothetical protein
MNAKAKFLTILPAILIAAVFFIDPIPQDPAYYSFADSRSFMGVPNFWNVMSNVPFLLVGAFGIYYSALEDRPGMMTELRSAYIVFFAGIFLTGFGSAYFHYAPGDSTLLWDRLPMTLGFMAFLAIIVGEHISVPVGKRMLLPLLIVGAGSVIYWNITEARGAGDLRPYAIVQFLPMLVIPLILLMYRSAYDKVAFLWLILVLYAVSKLFEQFDMETYEIGRLISGHSIKHVVAALGALVFLYGVNSRRTLVGESVT